MDEERLSPEITLTAEPESSETLPAVLPEPIPFPFPSEAVPHRRRISRKVLTRILTSFLIVTAVTVYAACTVTFLLEQDFTAVHFFEIILSEFTGGTDYVRFTENTVSQESTVRLPEELSAELPSDTLSQPELPEAADESDFRYDFPVTRLDMSSHSQNSLGLINETPYTPDLNALADAVVQRITNLQMQRNAAYA